jgi:hypothetical protein
MCICPKRFYEVDFLTDIITHCWRGKPPANPRFAYEVKMAGFGTVDFVIADVDPVTNVVGDFVSVELQAVDITGSVEMAYNAILNSQPLMTNRISYGVNWANVRKRYIAQLITKGFFHHHWGTRIISVIQTPLYAAFRKDIQFDELAPDSNTANVVFMLYDYQPAPEKGEGSYKMVFEKAIGTSHNSLMMAALYRTPPPKEEFCKKIIERLR